jgi:hypothetical protein
LYKKKRSIETEFLERKHKVDHDTRVVFREEQMTKQIKGIKNKYDLEKEYQLTEEAISSAKRLVKDKPNEFKAFKVIQSANIKTRNKNNKALQRPNTAQVYSRVRSASKYFKNNSTTIGSESKPDIYRNKTTLFLTTGSTFGSDSPCTTERQKPTTRINSSFGFRFIKSPTSRGENKMTNAFTQTLTLSDNIPTQENEVPLLKKIGSSKLGLFKNFFSKIIKDMEYKVPIDSKVILSRDVRNTINCWKKYTSGETKDYSTGSISMPLYTQLK